MKTQKTQHTPGPWFIDGNGDIRSRSIDDPITFAVPGRQRFLVCREPGTADANLIIAAPTMLSELESLREWFYDLFTYVCEEDCKIKQGLINSAEKLDKIIKEAKGIEQ